MFNLRALMMTIYYRASMIDLRALTLRRLNMSDVLSNLRALMLKPLVPMFQTFGSHVQYLWFPAAKPLVGWVPSKDVTIY